MKANRSCIIRSYAMLTIRQPTACASEISGNYTKVFPRACALFICCCSSPFSKMGCVWSQPSARKSMWWWCQPPRCVFLVCVCVCVCVCVYESVCVCVCDKAKLWESYSVEVVYTPFIRVLHAVLRSLTHNTRTHTHMHTHKHTHTRTRTHTHTLSYTHKHTHMNAHVHACRKLIPRSTPYLSSLSALSTMASCALSLLHTVGRRVLSDN